MDALVVTEWTGQTAQHLQEASRLTIERFAEHLGVAPRTVAKWRAESDLVLSAGMQQILDVALKQAAEPVRVRFARLVGCESPAPRRPAPAAQDPVVAQMAADMALMQARIDQLQEQLGQMALRFLTGN